MITRNRPTSAALLRRLATELPALAAQAASTDVSVRAACVLRLKEFAQLLAPYRPLHRPQTFAAWSIKRDD